MKKAKAFAAAALAGVMMFSFTACANFKLISHKDFIGALEDELKMDDDDYSEYKNSSVGGDATKHEVYATDGDCHYVFIEFKDEDDAFDYFEDIYDGFQDAKEDKDLKGSYRFAINEKGQTGYILLNGESKSDDFIDDDFYGGIFLKENTIVMVYATSDKKSDKSDIDAVLSAIGYPKP